MTWDDWFNAKIAQGEELERRAFQALERRQKVAGTPTIWMPCQNYFPNRNGWTPKWIILHGTAGGTSAQAIANYFISTTQGKSNPVSAHYIIGTDGTIVACISESDGSYANGYVSVGHDTWWSEVNNPNPNNVSISIEHCKASTDNSDALTPAQKASSFALIANICERWNIPMRPADAHGGITGHFSLDPVNRSRCPGAYPWDELWAFLNGEQSMRTYGANALDFSDWFTNTPDGAWTCKSTNAVLMGSNLALYQTLSIDGDTLPVIGLPLESEQYHKLADGYEWSTQRCERATINYDPEHRIDSAPGQGASYLAHVNPPQTADDVRKILVEDIKALLTFSDNIQKALTPLLVKIAADADIVQ
jgi:N-acetyl-anhydromuramyl-L-alanine amidase AmpD